MYGADGEVPQINEEWEPPSGFVEWDEGAPPPGPPAGFPEDSDELGRPLPKLPHDPAHGTVRFGRRRRARHRRHRTRGVGSGAARARRPSSAGGFRRAPGF